MKKIEYGTVNVPAEAFLPKNTKVRITTLLDGDVLLACKKEAARQGLPYQTLINSVLRDRFVAGNSVEKRLERLERAVYPRARRNSGQKRPPRAKRSR